MVFKTWLSDINKVALAMDGLQSITQFKTGSTIANGMELSAVAVNKYKVAIDGLTLSQAKTALSTTALNEAQQKQILLSAGLLTSTDSLTASELKQVVSENILTTAKQQEVLATFETEMAEGKLNLERLKGITFKNADAEAIRQLILAKEAENAENLKNIASNKALTAVLKEQLIALASNPITWLVAGLAGTAVVLHNTSKAIDEVRQSASELNNEFSDSKSSVDGYKSQIDDLYKTINDSNSSVQEVTTARQTLMTVQDELIDKFGDEKEIIDLVTQAINGQSSALDTLTQKKWQETKNEFNESDMWNDFANWQEGYSDNIDRMVNEMENAWGNIKLSTSDYYGGEYDDIIKRLEDAGWKYSSSSETFVKGGSVEDLYEEIVEIQTLVGEDMPDNFLKSLTNDANKLKNTLDSYEGMWDNYILNDKIFADDNLADSWKEVNDAYSKYQNAVVSGDSIAIEGATAGFATSINEVLNDENVSDSVKDYFKDMYPALYREVEKWEFKTNIIPTFDTKGLDGKTEADVLEMLQTDGTQDGENTFNAIVDSAIEYGLILDDDAEGIQKVLDLLVEWGILQGTIADSTDDDTNKIELQSFEEAWKALDTTEDDTLKNTKKDLTELAEAGKLTSEAFSDVEGASTWADGIGLSAEEATKKVNALVDSSKPLASLKSSIGSIQDAYAEKKENKVVGADTLSSMEEEFGDLKYWEKYKQILGSTTSSLEDCKKAQNKLATQYVNSKNFLTQLTEENKDYYTSQLKEMGIINAEEVVNSVLEQKYKTLNELQSIDLSGLSGSAQNASKSFEVE